MSKKLYDFDLIVIGSGIGGSVAAQLSADMGKKTALIEESMLGGECTNWGCIPTKTMLSVAHIYDNAKQGDKLGLRSSTISYNYPSIRAWKNQVLRSSGLTESKGFFEKKGIKVITGHAGFLDPHTVIVGQKRYTAKNFLVSTGSRLIWPEIEGLNRIRYLTHHDAVDLPKAPKSIAIIGGGATASEFAELFSIFGSKVYIIEAGNRLLPREDKEVGEMMTTIFERNRHMTILTGTKVIRVRQVGAKKEVHCELNSDEQVIKVDEILLATGKAANVNLGLENAKVSYSKDGIAIDRACQTSQNHIFAVGDCTGSPHYTHIATMQARVAVHNMYHRQKMSMPLAAAPRVLFTSPEVASIGITSVEARKMRLRTKVVTASARVVPRSHIDNANDGFIKLIVDSKTKVLLGASIVSPHASEIIHELAVAMHAKMPVHQLQDVYHAFPTWSELVQVAVQKV